MIQEHIRTNAGRGRACNSHLCSYVLLNDHILGLKCCVITFIPIYCMYIVPIFEGDPSARIKNMHLMYHYLCLTSKGCSFPNSSSDQLEWSS